MVELKQNFPKDNTIEYEGDIITIKAYAPIEEKLNAIESILSLSLNPNLGLYMPGHVYVYRRIFMIKLYTDIKISDEEIDNAMATFDSLINEPWYKQVIDILNANEDVFAFDIILDETIEKLEKYQTSAYGILDSLKKDYQNMEIDYEKLQQKIRDKEGIELVDEIVKKLG